MLKKSLIVSAFLFLLTGAACNEPELKDGYQFGDATKIALRDYQKIVVYRNRYCAMTESDPGIKAARELAVTAIRVYVPMYPADGICTDLFDALSQFVSKEPS